MASLPEVSVVIGAASSETLPLILNALVAVIGGGLAAIAGGFVGARMTAKANRLQATHERNLVKNERQQAHLFSVHFKLIAIYSAVRQFHEQAGLSRLRHRTLGTPFRCSGHQPFSTDSEPITFTVDELNSVAEVGGDGLLAATATLDLQHNALIQNLALYRDKWFAAFDSLPKAGVGDGFVSIELTRAEMLKAAPSLMLLDNLLGQMDPMIQSLEKDAFDVVVAVLHARFQKFKRPNTIITVDPRTGRDITIKADAAASPMTVKPSL